MKLDFDKTPESDLIVNYVADRYRKGRYTLITVIGEPGGGKSNTCFRLAQLASIKIHGKDLITKDCMIDSNLKMAKFALNPSDSRIAVIEEMTVLFPSRRSMSGANLDASQILDTCRKKKLILFSNAPVFKSIDLAVRGHVKIVVEALGMSKKRGIVMYKMLKVKTNPMTGKPYFRRFSRDGLDVHRGFARFVSKELFEAYEEDKDKFMQKRYEMAVLRAKKTEEKIQKDLGIGKKVTFKKPLTLLEAEIHQKVNINGERQVDVAKDKGVGRSNINQILKRVNRKLQFIDEK